MESILGTQLRKGTATIKLSEAKFSGCKYIGLYFGAHWAPPCRLFSDNLIDWYSKANLEVKDFEVVFVSLDGNLEALKSNFKDMPWLAIPYTDKEKI